MEVIYTYQFFTYFYIGLSIPRILGSNQSEVGFTPLHGAAWNGHISILQLLISRGANTDPLGPLKLTPLLVAAQGGKLTCVKFLLDNGANIHAKDTEELSILHKASESDNEELVHLLLSKGVSVNDKDQFGYTAAHIAAYYGNVKVLKLLISKGANPLERDFQYGTLLHHASKGDHYKLLKYLLKHHSIDVNSKDKNEDTPLHIASLVGSRNCTKVLLSKGADPLLGNSDNLTPLHKAAYGGSVRYITICI